jgi:cutinase
MDTYRDMIAGHVSRFVGPVVVAAWGLGGAIVAPTVPAASADPCPDEQVIFARGTDEPPGLGQTGQAFVDGLRARQAGKSVDEYAVDYPANHEWATGLQGITDAGAHVVSMAGNCPNTKLVLGGYSQGAMAIDLATIAQAPVADLIPDILTADEASHVAALALFGNPSDRYLGAPVSEVSPWYGAKAIDLCAPGDPVCTPGGLLALPTHDELFSPVHLSYQQSGMPAQAATFVAGHL